MKIIYLHQYFTTPENSGGIRSYQFAKRLVAEGHQVDVITSSAFLKKNGLNNFFFIKKKNIGGITTHVINVPYSNKMNFVSRATSFLLFSIISSVYILTLKKRDLIFATSTPITIGIPALIGKRFLRIPMVFEVRDLWPDIPIKLGFITNRIAIKLLYLLESKIYDSAEKIIALSDGMKKGIEHKGVEEEKIVVIPNGCDIEEFKNSPTNHSELADFKINSSTKIGIYAGTLGKVNDIPYIIKLASALKKAKINIVLLIIGNGSEKQKVIRMATDLNLRSNIAFLDSKPKDQLIALLKACDFCISTTMNKTCLFDNSANKFFDSLAAGKPIIINYGGWQKDIIKQEKIGVVINNDFDASANLISDFIQESTSNNIETKILRFAARNYSRDELYKKLTTKVLFPGSGAKKL